MQYHIGKLCGSLTITPPSPTLVADAYGPFLDPKTWKSVALTSVERINHDSLMYRFALPSSETLLGLPVGQHVFVRLRRKDTGEVVQRAYTPVSLEGATGSIDFLIKYVS